MIAVQVQTLKDSWDALNAIEAGFDIAGEELHSELKSSQVNNQTLNTIAQLSSQFSLPYSLLHYEIRMLSILHSEWYTRIFMQKKFVHLVKHLKARKKHTIHAGSTTKLKGETNFHFNENLIQYAVYNSTSSKTRSTTYRKKNTTIK